MHLHLCTWGLFKSLMRFSSSWQLLWWTRVIAGCLRWKPRGGKAASMRLSVVEIEGKVAAELSLVVTFLLVRLPPGVLPRSTARCRAGAAWRWRSLQLYKWMPALILTYRWITLPSASRTGVLEGYYKRAPAQRRAGRYPALVTGYYATLSGVDCSCVSCRQEVLQI